jgi:arylsulfatase A
MKLHMYEGGIRVPGIIRWPGQTKPGQVCHEPVNGTDILPTFCEIAGVKLPSDRAVDGASMVPMFRGKRIERGRPLYWRYDRALSGPKVALRQGNWKLLGYRGLEKFELYNLEEDLRETNDLAAKAPQRLQRMITRLKHIHEDVEADPISR